jgi:hypothetical protein
MDPYMAADRLDVGEFFLLMSGLESAVITLQEAKTDEEIMVGLTLLPRYLDEKDPLVMETAFANIPWSFIHRLLIRPPNSQDSLMQRLGVHIWTSFCLDPFIQHSKFLKRLEPILDLLHSDVELDIKVEIVQHIIKLLLLRKNSHPFSEKQWSKLLGVSEMGIQELLLPFLEHFLSMTEDKELIAVVGTIAVKSLSRWIQVTNAFQIQVLTSLLNICSIVPNVKMDTDSVILYKVAIKKLLSGKVNSQVVQKTLVLCSFLSKSNRLLKVKSPSALQTPKGSVNVTDSKFLVIVTHLAAAEIRVTLDSTNEALRSQDNEMLPMFYSLVEDIVETLVEEKVKLDHSELSSVRTALAETFLAVGAYLAERWDLYVDTSNLGILDNITTIFSLGAYSKWIAEESTVSGEELERLTPLVVKVCECEYLRFM